MAEVDAHLRAERRLRALAARGVEIIWGGLPGYGDEDVPQWLSSVVPFVLAAQRQSVALTSAYLARALDRREVGVDTEALVGAAVRNGSPPEEVYRRPFVTLWTKLGEGVPFAAASHAALARASSTAEMDVQLSMRATAGAVQASDSSIVGYRRVANADACSFCSEIDGAFVKSADAAALHTRCGCSLEPITSRPRKPVEQADAEGTAIHTHGEVGPVLGDPTHNFQTNPQ